MTARGTLSLVLIGVTVVLALGSGNRGLFIFALFLLLFCLLALISLLLAAMTVRAYGSLDKEQTTRGESVQYRLDLRGVVLLPLTGHIVLLPPGADPKSDMRHRNAFFLRPSLIRQQQSYQVEMVCEHRGHWYIQPEKLLFQDIFGLFSLPLIRKRHPQPDPVELIVYPCVYELEGVDETPATTEGFTTTLVRNATNGELFGDTREHQPGDPIRRIHWKQTARSGKLYIRQFEAQENPMVLLLLDLACRHTRVEETADILSETTAALALHGVNTGKTVQVLLLRKRMGNQTVDGGAVWLQNARDFDRLIPTLVDAAFYTDEHPLDAWQLHDSRFLGAGTIRVITDNPSAKLLETLDQLARRGHKTSCFVSSADKQLSLTTQDAVRNAANPPVPICATAEIPEKVGAAL